MPLPRAINGSMAMSCGLRMAIDDHLDRWVTDLVHDVCPCHGDELLEGRLVKRKKRFPLIDKAMRNCKLKSHGHGH